MLWRKVSTAFCLLAAMSSLALGQVKLERKVNEGTNRTVETTTRTEQSLVIAGTNTQTSSEARTVVKVSVGKRDDAGQVRVQEKVDSLQITSKIMGSEYVFDSSNPDKTGSSPLEMMRPVHKALVGRTTTSVFDKSNTITSIEFDQAVLNGLDEQVRGLVKSQLDPEKMKEAANEETKRIPTEAVKKGDTWERTSKMNLGGGQVLTVTTRYTYEGEIEKEGRKLDRITSKSLTVDFALEPDSPLPLTVKSSELKPSESKGEILFDRALGQAVETSGSVTIVGNMTFVIMGNELPSKLNLTMESSTVVKP